jgi:hypothetical protein
MTGAPIWRQRLRRVLSTTVIGGSGTRRDDDVSFMRRRLIAVALAAAVGAGSWALVSTAGAETSVPASSTAVSSTAVYIYPSLALISAEVGRAGSTARRRFDAYHTAVFVQSWIGVAISGTVKHVPLSAGVSIYRVDATGTWNGAGEVSTRTIFYASDGRRAWIALPPSSETPVAALSWWLAPERVIAAFAGTVKLVPTLGTDAASPTTTTVAPARTGGANRSAAGWLAAGIAAVAGVAVVVAVGPFRRRWRRTRSGRSRRPVS